MHVTRTISSSQGLVSSFAYDAALANRISGEASPGIAAQTGLCPGITGHLIKLLTPIQRVRGGAQDPAHLMRSWTMLMLLVHGPHLELQGPKEFLGRVPSAPPPPAPCMERDAHNRSCLFCLRACCLEVWLQSRRTTAR